MSRELGHTGEAVAAKYYIRRGYLLLNHNYRTRMGDSRRQTGFPGRSAPEWGSWT